MRSRTVRHGPPRSGTAARLTLAVLGLLHAGGCNVDVRDGLGPRVPQPDVEGTVLRGSSPAIRVDVELHDVAGGIKVFDTRSNQYGSFAFAGVEGGLWEVRAESDLPGDFATVSREFFRTDGDGRVRLRDLDIFAHGASLVAPAPGAVVTPPTPFDPLDFHWTSPDVAGAVAQVRLEDATGQDVWRSSPGLVDSVRWYGYGSEGSYQGVPVGPGVYQWRVKFEFPDTTEARTELRMLRLE